MEKTKADVRKEWSVISTEVYAQIEAHMEISALVTNDEASVRAMKVLASFTVTRMKALSAELKADEKAVARLSARLDVIEDTLNTAAYAVRRPRMVRPVVDSAREAAGVARLCIAVAAI